jgi:hypothetical protein
MARIGKIARLPWAVRAQLNSRLQIGHQDGQILPWLNSLPEVREFLDEMADGRPLTGQDLTDWRLGGYQDWLALVGPPVPARPPRRVPAAPERQSRLIEDNRA